MQWQVVEYLAAFSAFQGQKKEETYADLIEELKE
tara:strand:+ start:373 stop:474 length:102 start_codon:yes stop_codon:yes gene_type:complete